MLGRANIGWLDWIIDLHRNLLAGKSGRKLVGVIGIALFLMSLSGLGVWMQSNPRWRDAVRIHTSGSTRRLVFDAHRSVGILAMVIILVQSFTGIWLAYPQTLKMLSAKPSVKKDKKRKRSGSVPISAFLKAATGAIPDGTLAELKMPDGDGKVVQVRMRRAGDVRPGGDNTVTLDPSSATVMSVERFSEMTPVQKMVESVTPVHYGEWGGIGARILLGVLGFVPVVLVVSGFLVWWIPRRLRARKERAELIPETVLQ